MPACEAADSHAVRVFAPSEIVFEAASNLDLLESRVVRGIFKLREMILGENGHEEDHGGDLLTQAKKLGWGVLAEIPDREVIVGAVTRPWESDVVFREVPAEEFAAFCEPDYVKIAWTLRTDPVNAMEAILRTETRVSTTDACARAKFRMYWSAFSPGIMAIRKVWLRSAKKKAEYMTLNPKDSVDLGTAI